VFKLDVLYSVGVEPKWNPCTVHHLYLTGYVMFTTEHNNNITCSMSSVNCDFSNRSR